ncbi:MAG: Chorismate pyruvate-lyase [Candidatus Erwinia impunctatus]|nr:Chorismate pyruvate-lyase [Culicoides impunctatus]
MPRAALTKLKAMHWLSDASLRPSSWVLDWLMTESSMTQRLAGYCQHIHVEVITEGMIPYEALSGDELNFLPVDALYWQREVILYGDECPWLAGRTVLPESTLTGDERALLQLGNQPLGHYLFTSPSLIRDFIKPGCSGELWGRRSGLQLSGKPLLLTELFLADAPLYQSFRRCGK